MHKPESTQEKKMCKILWDFETDTDQLITVRWSEQLTIPGEHSENQKVKKRSKYLDYQKAEEAV